MHPYWICDYIKLEFCYSFRNWGFQYSKNHFTFGNELIFNKTEYVEASL